MLTTAVFAVVLTAPLGAIMINTLGTKFLEYDGDDPELLAKHGFPMPDKAKDEGDPEEGAGDSAGEGSEGQKQGSDVEMEMETRPRAGLDNISSIQDESQLDASNVEKDSQQQKKNRRHNKINSVTPMNPPR